MHEAELHQLIQRVRSGALGRRSFIRQLAGLGLGAPTAGLLQLHAGLADAQNSAYQPSRRGGGGTLRALWWQGPTQLHPHRGSSAERDGARIFYEPLASWDADGRLLPILAAEIPTPANGGVAPDGRSVVWKLKPGVRWHDGQPFGADDCVFTWQHARHPANAAATRETYQDLDVTALDAHTLRVGFARPTPFWATAFVGADGMILPRHRFAPAPGGRAPDAAALQPVGTGPYRFVDFRPGELLRGEINPQYHMPLRPFFDRIELAGGGDALSAARAVLHSGTHDYAWNLALDDELLRRLETGGRGRAQFVPAGDIEFLQLNPTDPLTEVDGERSSLKTRHFAFADPAVRRALALLVDRQSMQDFIHGRSGIATANFIDQPPPLRSPNNRIEFSVDRANRLLDAAGWQRGADGIRAKDGRALRLLFQTSVHALRQKQQALIEQACRKAGIALELKAVTASVFFSADPASPDTFARFQADLQMYTTSMTQPDPLRFMDQFLSWEVASRANRWQGRNVCRWVSDAYDSTWRAAEQEADPVRRAALCVRLNDLPVQDGVIVPLLNRPRVRGVARGLVAPLSGWDLDFAALHDWHRA